MPLAAHFPGLEGAGKPTPTSVAQSGVKEVLAMLREYGEGHATLSEAALARLTVLCSHTGGAREGGWFGSNPAEGASAVIAGSDGLSLVVNAMLRHPQAVPLQTYCCSLLGMLCDREERVRQAADARGLEAIVRAMKAFSEPELQTGGCLALGQLSSTPERSKLASELGAIPLVVSAMRERPERAVLQANGCMALANLAMGERLGSSSAARASDAKRSKIAVDAGALVVIVGALKRHAAHDGVLHWGTTVVMRLTHNSPERAQLALAAGARETLAAAAALPTTQGLINVAAKVELAVQWLAMHEEHTHASSTSPLPKGADGGRQGKLEKAQRVFKDLIYEQCACDGELPEATGMTRVARSATPELIA